MGSDSFMTLFDVIILFYGVYLIYGACQMKRTHQPSSLIINQGDLIGARDVKGFCEALFKPLLAFGIAAIIYGILNLVNDRYLKEPMIDFVAMPVFLVLCFWFLRMMKKCKKNYLR